MARSNVDVARLSAAASRPGIDPRINLTRAVVTEIGFDPNEGYFADVQFQPGGEAETAYVGMPYAGRDFGMHCPVDVGDTVLVALPNGDPGEGPVIIARWHNAGDRPNSELADGEEATHDFWLRVKPGQRLVLRTSGGDVDIKVEESGNVNVEAAQGNVNVVVSAAGKVNVGSASLQAPLQGAVNGEAIDPFTGATQASLGNASQVVAVKKLPG